MKRLLYPSYGVTFPEKRLGGTDSLEDEISSDGNVHFTFKHACQIVWMKIKMCGEIIYAEIVVHVILNV